MFLCLLSPLIDFRQEEREEREEEVRWYVGVSVGKCVGKLVRWCVGGNVEDSRFVDL